MTTSIEMKKLFEIDKYSFYYTGKRFVFKGFWLSTKTNKIRILPLNKFKNWTAKYNEEN